ncbi:putative molybdopterin biosynthesis protein MoeA/LysR substrate binding-domain-containing protein [uncultured Roseburia sp.]|uniref:Molybdopterin molybdenumtransferase n=1 Tax=Brotonthovivens ammoniilytica TaxID=2981725 RepID=A0ABT2TEW3_9FIRM|nr:molybdopterin-binding protein [Brotonthovivens ammoniilytica]MCU6760718.1 molybdopterin-binding protein [Brotonthovivens ammoniilytica]SCI06937.1 putative molybdopterin biosynthesis protein MoeA/LysR substrate binding-domain-containing protein [uncultured Roseburia sp.]
MKLIKTEDAVGHVLCQDITQIIKGVTKDAVFRKGHVVTKEDIPVLLSVGKEHLYVWENDENMLHENEAAQILYEICRGEHMHGTDVKEGKIELVAEIDGLLKVNKKRILAVNSFGQMMIASRHGNVPIKKGDKIAGTRIIPLVIEKEKMEKARQTGGSEPVFQLLPFKHKKVGIVTTGSEVFKGRIKDTFGPVIKGKLAEFPTEVLGQTYVDDTKKNITAAIMDHIANGADMVVCTGGMSVDPDDCTPGAIADTGARVVSYGAPVLPGAMLMIAYYQKDGKEIPILGLPGCVMYAKRTIFDLVLPRVMADDKLEKEDISILGEGGLCLNCEVCTYPNCGFGK